MSTTRRRVRRRRVKAKRPKFKKVELNPDIWLRNTEDIRNFREQVLKLNGGVCEMTGETVKRPALDHSHVTGQVRGVISQHNNTMEGYVNKYFNKYVKNHTTLTKSEWLRSLANYYESDWSTRLLHFKTVTNKEDQLNRLTKDAICAEIFNSYGIDLTEKCDNMVKLDLINEYIKRFVEDLEGS